MVNAIKSKPLSCRLFSQICDELGSEHQSLLFHNGVRWLSRGKVLSRLHELLHEFNVFVIENESCSNFLQYLEDDEWKVKLAYLADIFGLLNELNLQIQGTGMNCFTYMNKIDAFKKSWRCGKHWLSHEISKYFNWLRKELRTTLASPSTSRKSLTIIWKQLSTNSIIIFNHYYWTSRLHIYARHHSRPWHV